ncbi:MAG: tetratricopeptide repeat protein [Bacteroidetes bacterium]|nr:tetratricopeptide repeat protein [Bacteroidota bacterium]
MRKTHYITLGLAVGLIAILYWGVNTTPPLKKETKMSGANTASGPISVEAASFDSILEASNKQLTTNAVSEIEAINQKIGATKDSSQMAPFYWDLGKKWQENKQFPVAAYYYAKSAKLENSEKNLNFAGQLFLDLVHNAGSQAMQAWEGQEAVACFTRSLELNPANDTVKMALAAAYIEGVGQTMQGVQLLLGITREKPDNIPANLMLGRLAIQSGQYDKAIQRFENILKLEPENTEAMYFLAEGYKGKGDKAKAIELFEQCKKIVNKPEFSKEIDQYINSFK